MAGLSLCARLLKAKVPTSQLNYSLLFDSFVPLSNDHSFLEERQQDTFIRQIVFN